MKAAICTGYGSPEVLQIRDVPKPTPKHYQVLVKIHAADVNASDCIVRGFKLSRWSPKGIMMGAVIGFRRPRNPILGMIFAGEIEAVGEGVKRYKPGDAVFGTTIKGGMNFGTYAEYKCLSQDSIMALKPASISYVEAAAVPYGAGLALCFLKKGRLQRGQKILIYGASGAIGTAAVQLAMYHFGADVTGVCSTKNLDLVLSLGAERVIDYTKEDAATLGERYDLILDAVGKRKSSTFKEQCQQALTGKYISVDGGNPHYTLDDMRLFADLLETGKFKAVIDRCYPLDDIVEAHRYVDTGHKRGNVILTIA
ncbi:MAG: NAD(P)-dependent alcohol dehydrogenase [Chloroflexi bacterium]|nr:NAD(P)-dependent alcohol dehydrogenase [Chloroflexota bacterium]